MTTTVNEISDAFVDRFAALDPVTATFEGIPGHDTELTDYSPDGAEERRLHAQSVLRDLDAAPLGNDLDRIAAEVLRHHLVATIDLAAAGEDLRALRVIGSPVSEVRICFDLMPRETVTDWETIAARAAAVPHSLDTLIASLREGMNRNLVAAQRQVLACARQADTWGGLDDSHTAFFLGLVEEYDTARIDDPALRARLDDVATRATAAYAALGRFLVGEYLPAASEHDAVGAERYALWARVFNGTELDLPETYEWGWEELTRIEHAMRTAAERILPGEPLPAVIEHLENDPTRMIEGEDALREWLQELIDRTIAELGGVHFDIPDAIMRCEAMIAPPGGAAAMYYTGPSEDFARPGRTWYPTLGRTRFPLWGEVSTCYHEAVPGHHLQIGMMRYLADRLNRFQRTLASNSGHAEGWALYAERLMGELGYLDDAAFELGMLRAQAMRAVRVIVDIGLHLELPIPATESFHSGERWTPDLALPFVIERSHFDEEFMTSEVDRYLGWPGQAISYKVGERVWLECRDEAKRRATHGFDLKTFHSRALELGPMGLDQLRQELGRL
ncbi:MAG: DUF885 domain-containing protein [Acidimicrobiia bacterium]